MKKILILVLSCSVLTVVGCKKFQSAPISKVRLPSSDFTSNPHVMGEGDAGGGTGISTSKVQTSWANCRENAPGSTRYVISLVNDQMRMIADAFPVAGCAGDTYESFVIGKYRLANGNTVLRRTVAYPEVSLEDALSVNEDPIISAAIDARQTETELRLHLTHLQVQPSDFSTGPIASAGDLTLTFQRLKTRPDEIISGVLTSPTKVPRSFNFGDSSAQSTYVFENELQADNFLKTETNNLVDVSCINQYLMGTPEDLSDKFDNNIRGILHGAPLHADLQKAKYAIGGLSLSRYEDKELRPYAVFWLQYNNLDPEAEADAKGTISAIICPLKSRAPGVAVPQN